MGSEQSVPSGSRSQSQDDPSLTSPSVSSRPIVDPLLSLASTSPQSGHLGRQDSVASDAEGSVVEVPYVSYTVSKPIGGDSPKKDGRVFRIGKTSRSGVTGTSRLSFPSSLTSSKLSKSKHNTLVVVGKGNQEQSDVANDPELQRLREIPSFLPIMRASLNSSSVKDPDILERLDYRGIYALAQKVEDHLRVCAVLVSSEQAELNESVKEVDQKVSFIVQKLNERQKELAKCSEKLKQVNEMSKCLNKCHILLNENLEHMEALNNMLSPENRLEPFVWTTG